MKPRESYWKYGHTSYAQLTIPVPACVAKTAWINGKPVKLAASETVQLVRAVNR